MKEVPPPAPGTIAHLFDPAAVSPQPRFFVARMAACSGLSALSIDILLPAFPKMRRSFGLATDSTRVSLVITVFFLGLAAGQLVYGPLSDRFGRRPLLLIGLGVFVGGAFATSLSGTLATTLVFRFVWGLGAAACRSLSIAMVRDTSSGDRMARTLSLVMATFIVVPVIAPSVTAGLLHLAPWRIVYWIPIVCAVALAVSVVLMPETLPVERRRSVGPAALLDAMKTIGRTRGTVGYGLAVLFLFGVMSSYIGGSQTIFDEVFHQRERFPLLFGVVAIGMGAGALASARIVSRVGLDRLLRALVVALSVNASLLLGGALIFGGKPPLWLFVASLFVFLPSCSVLIASCNTAAMMPVATVAGMAAALLGTISTAGGSLLGAVSDHVFNGSVTPFAACAFGYAAVATVCIRVIAQRVPRPEPALVATT